MLRVVQFCGGRGSITITQAFLTQATCSLTSIINAYDDGRSTGLIRQLFRMLGPSDIRKVQESMVSRDRKHRQQLLDLFAYRFPEGADHDKSIDVMRRFVDGETSTLGEVMLPDDETRRTLRMLTRIFLERLPLYEGVHDVRFDFGNASLMNCLYAGAYEMCGRDLDATVSFFDRFLETEGEVLPTNVEDKKLVGVRDSGVVLYSEAEIVESRSNVRIREVFIVDEYPDRVQLDSLPLAERHRYLHSIQSHVQAAPRVLNSIRNADIIVYAPGTQHSSLYPSYMTRGITEAIVANPHAVKVFVANIGEDYETPSYTASELIEGAYRYLTLRSQHSIPISAFIDYALVNTATNKPMQNYVPADEDRLDSIGVAIVYGRFEDESNLGKHDGKKVVATCMDLYRDRFYGAAEAMAAGDGK